MGAVLRRAGFVLVAAYLLLSPALPQLFGWGGPWVRQWTMYSEVGFGLLKGEFTVQYADGRSERLAPLDVLGLSRYPDIFHYQFEPWVTDASDLAEYAAAFCASERELMSLAFDGQVGVMDGWAELSADQLCAAPVEPGAAS